MLIVFALVCISFTTLYTMQYIPKVGRLETPPRLRSNTHSHSLGHMNESVALIIRSHGGYSNALVSMLWGMEAQSTDLRMLALILPTEYPAAEVLHHHLQRHWSYYHYNPGKVASTTVMNIPKAEYDSHCCDLDRLCVDDWRQKLVSGGWSKDTVRRYCEVNSPLHYHLTDRALSFVVDNCTSCKHVVVTNADNSYTPDFLQKATALMASGAYDIVLVNMLHRGNVIEVAPENGKLDLGCALLSIDFLRKNKLSFLSSLPQPTEPQHYHDADFWMIDNCIKHGARIGYIREVLFNHN